MKSGNETATVTILNVHTVEKVKKFIACSFNCAKGILQGTSSNEEKGHTMQISNCSQYVCAKLVLHVNGQQIYLDAFQNMLSDVIKANN